MAGRKHLEHLFSRRSKSYKMILLLTYFNYKFPVIFFSKDLTSYVFYHMHLYVLSCDINIIHTI